MHPIMIPMSRAKEFITLRISVFGGCWSFEKASRRWDALAAGSQRLRVKVPMINGLPVI